MSSIPRQQEIRTPSLIFGKSEEHFTHSKSVRDFSEQWDFLEIFDGVFSETKGVFA